MPSPSSSPSSRLCGTLLVMLGLGLTGLQPAAALAADDLPWFSQKGAERMVQRALPEYYAYLQGIQARSPAKYQERLHQAMMLLHSSDATPDIFAAWTAVWDAERRYMARVEAWKAAPADQKPAIRAELLALSTEWEQARLALFATKIPTFEDRLYNLELSLQDVQMNLDSYAEERVMHSLQE